MTKKDTSMINQSGNSGNESSTVQIPENEVVVTEVETERADEQTAKMGGDEQTTDSEEKEENQEETTEKIPETKQEDDVVVKAKKPRKPRKKKTVENTDNVDTVVEEKPVVVVSEEKEEKPVTKTDNTWLWALVGLVAIIVAVMIFKIVKENANG